MDFWDLQENTHSSFCKSGLSVTLTQIAILSSKAQPTGISLVPGVGG